MTELAPNIEKPRHVRLKKIELIFFVLGLSFLGYLVYKFGFETLLTNLARTGWTFALIIGLWFIIYILNTTSWRLVLGCEVEGISFPHLFRIIVSGFALNDLTPVLGLGGETYRMSVLSERMGRGRSVSSVTLYRMIYSLGHLLLLFTGVVVALVALRLPTTLMFLFGLVGVALLAIISILLSGHRRGVFERVVGRLQRVRVIHRLLEKFSVSEESLKRMDEIITSAYHERRRDFYGAVSIEYVTRCCMAIEIFFILRGIGLDVGIAQAFFLYLTYSLLVNILFAVPYNVGVREGGFYFALESLALPPMIGIYLGIVMRIREFFWILLGLLFILLAGVRRPKVT